MNIVGSRKIFYAISGIFVIGSIVSMAVYGLNLGIDFKGGSLIEVEYQDSRPGVSDLTEKLEGLGYGAVVIQPSGKNVVLIRLKSLTEDEHQNVLKVMAEDGSILERRFDSIGPTIGKELKRKAIYAIVAALIAIVLYMTWAFRQVSKPVSSWKYGIVAIIALFHDVLIPTGIFSFFQIEMGVLFVTALLTVLGFSVHDTIVVFDRVRENLKKMRNAEFDHVVEMSVHETIMRSIMTSLTTILALLAIYIFGGNTTQTLSLALMIGILVGTYSSIFIASPLLVTWHKYQKSKWKARK